MLPVIVLAIGLLSGLTCAWPAERKRGVDCSFSTTIEDGATCESFAKSWGISIEKLGLLNPGIACPEPVAGTAYCVIGTVNDSPPTTITTAKTSTSTLAKTTSTNVRTSITTSSPTMRSITTTINSPTGATTPLPTQPGMVSNCNKFYFVKDGAECSQVLRETRVSLEDLFNWNPSILEDCSGLWANVHVCIGITGRAISTKTQMSPSTTRAGNSVETPLPIQPDMVSNCGRFYFVKKGMTCAQVLSETKVSLADLYKWNPSVEADCSGLWADVNVCVGVTDSPSAVTNPTTTLKPRTTRATGNGIETPLPTQPGMVSTCRKFHWIAKGVNCGQILSYNKISMADFYKWNPGVGSDCTSMWAETYVCVGV